MLASHADSAYKGFGQYALPGLGNPYSAVGANRYGTGILWPMAGGLRRMSRRLGAKGHRTDYVRFLPPGLGSKD